MGKENKGRLRELFGRFGDVSRHLSRMFGNAYLDHHDDTRGEKLWPEIIDLEGATGETHHEVTGLIGRSIEKAPEVTCEHNQQILLSFLKDHMGFQESPISFEEGWAITKHAKSCSNIKCQRLNAIAIRDNVSTPTKMKSSFGEEIKDWIIE